MVRYIPRLQASSFQSSNEVLSDDIKLTRTLEFGKEKAESLAGLTDKEIEEKVAKLVQSAA